MGDVCGSILVFFVILFGVLACIWNLKPENSMRKFVFFWIYTTKIDSECMPPHDQMQQPQNQHQQYNSYQKLQQQQPQYPYNTHPPPFNPYQSGAAGGEYNPGAAIIKTSAPADVMDFKEFFKHL
jgi:hypothetical protein